MCRYTTTPLQDPNSSAAITVWYAWSELSQPYVKNWQILTCPSQGPVLRYAGSAPGQIRVYSYARQLGYFNGNKGQPWTIVES